MTLKWNPKLWDAEFRTNAGGKVMRPDDGRVKLSREKVLEIRAKFAMGDRSKKSLSREYAVTETCVRNIINRLAWKDL